MSNTKHIFNTYYNALCNYAVKIVKDNATAEDLVQALFIQLWENNKLNDLENPERFLLRCTKFKCIDYLRKQKQENYPCEEEIPSSTTMNTMDFDESDIEPLFYFFAAKLPPKTREVFLLSRTSNLTYAQIAHD